MNGDVISNTIEHLGHIFVRDKWLYTTTTQNENGKEIILNRYICDICYTDSYIHRFYGYTFYISEGWAFHPLALSCNECVVKKLLE
jgi:hypothetical protein